MQLERGALIAERYRLDEPLGEGGMAVVWAATHVLTGKTVALKCLRPDVFDTRSNEARRRFLREAKASGLVDHPAVVAVHDVFEHADLLVMVMERLYGETLRDRLERVGRLSVDECIEVMAPVVSAVGAAHAAGIVHRDLKPENIFLSSRPPPVRVLDFGIAKLDRSKVTQGKVLTATGSVLGTPHYMPPEQIFGERDLDARADVWAVGVILHECLTGTRPFEGDNPGQALKAILSTRAPHINETNPDVPGDVADLVAGMLQRERDARPRDLRAAFEVLSRRVGQPVQAFGPAAVVSRLLVTPVDDGSRPDASGRLDSSRQVLAATIRDGVTNGTMPSGARRGGPRLRRRLVPVALAIAALAVGAGVLAWPRSRVERGEPTSPTVGPAHRSPSPTALSSGEPARTAASPSSLGSPSAEGATSPPPTARPRVVAAVRPTSVATAAAVPASGSPAPVVPPTRPPPPQLPGKVHGGVPF